MVEGKIKLDFGKNNMLMTSFTDIDDHCEKTYAIAIKQMKSHSSERCEKPRQSNWCADVLMIFKDVHAVDDLIVLLNELKDSMPNYVEKDCKTG